MNLDNNFESGWVGGFNIGADSLIDQANSMGLSSLLTTADDVRFWAGATYENRASAAFNVTRSGILSATGAIISGTITATSGVIGGFTIGSTTLTAGSGVTAIRLDSTGYIITGDSTLGADDSVVISQNSVSIMGYSPNYWITMNGGNGTIKGGGWTYGGSYTFGVVLTLDFTNGDYTSLGGVMQLRTAANALRITLDGTNGDGTFVGTVRANTAFNHNGTAGVSATFDPTAITSMTFSGGILTAYS